MNYSIISDHYILGSKLLSIQDLSKRGHSPQDDPDSSSSDQNRNTFDDTHPNFNDEIILSSTYELHKDSERGDTLTFNMESTVTQSIIK